MSVSSRSEKPLSGQMKFFLATSNEETAVRRYGDREIRVVYEEIEPETYLIYTVIKAKTLAT